MRDIVIIGRGNRSLDEGLRFHVEHAQDRVVQLGNIGNRECHESYYDGIKSAQLTNHSILFGTEDFYPYLYSSEFSLGDYKFEDDILFIRGGSSDLWVDKEIGDPDYPENTPNASRWINEGLPAITFARILQHSGPVNVVVSHECPESIAYDMFGETKKSLHHSGLDAVLENFSPTLWVFTGTYPSKQMKIGRTNFVCLGEWEKFIIKKK